MKIQHINFKELLTKEVCQFKNIGESMVARKIAAGFASKEALDAYLSPKLAKIMKTKERSVKITSL